MLALHDWQSFYTVTATAAATLVGLLFVAISIGGYIPEKEAREYTRTFVSPILINYAQVLILSCIALMPVQNGLIFPIAVVILGIINIFLVSKVLWRIQVVHRNDRAVERDNWIWHVVVPGIGSLLLLVGAVDLFYNGQIAPLVVAVAELLYLALGLRNTWTLMIWLTVHSGGRFTASERERRKEKV